MKAMSSLLYAPLALVLAVGATGLGGCASSPMEKRQEALKEAREETREAQQATQEAIQTVHETQEEYIQNRRAEINRLDQRLAEMVQQRQDLDNRIQEFQQTRQIVLRDLDNLPRMNAEQLAAARQNLDQAMNRLRRASQVASRPVNQQ